MRRRAPAAGLQEQVRIVVCASGHELASAASIDVESSEINVVHSTSRPQCHATSVARYRTSQQCASNPNRRNNVSCAIIKRRKSTPPGQTPRCVLIDCGKTFREAICSLFPKHGLREIGALLLTHGHADAILGMDDLRDLQAYEQIDPGVRYNSGPIHVYLHEETMQVRRLDERRDVEQVLGALCQTFVPVWPRNNATIPPLTSRHSKSVRN